MIPDAEENSINFSPPRWICPELLTESCMLMLPWRGMRVPTGKFDGKFDGKFGVQTQRNGAVLKWKTTVLHLQEDQICASQGDGGWSLSLPSHSAWNLLGYRFFWFIRPSWGHRSFLPAARPSWGRRLRLEPSPWIAYCSRHLSICPAALGDSAGNVGWDILGLNYKKDTRRTHVFGRTQG